MNAIKAMLTGATAQLAYHFRSDKMTSILQRNPGGRLIMALMRQTIRLIAGFIFLAACQSQSTSPANATATDLADALAQAIATADSLAATATAISAATEAAPTATPSITPTPTITPTPDPFPDAIVGSIYVAEQRFEGGWMFWLQPNSQIWVLTTDGEGQNIWSVYDDAFVDGEAESDPQILPPEDRFQPIRGFGKLWRENPEVRLAIGWAVGAELGHTTGYAYHHGGYVNESNEYVPEPGYHQVESLSGDSFVFIEGARSWRIDD